MELKRISDHEIEAVLSDEEMEELGITDSPDSYGDAAEAMIAAARSELGFTGSSAGSHTELTLTETGCVMRIMAADGCDHPDCLFLFDSVDRMIPACRLLDCGKVTESCLYRLDGGLYCLHVRADVSRGGAFDGLPYAFVSASEMCCRFFSGKAPYLYYVKEHGEPVFTKNAVNRIANSETEWYNR